VPTWRKPADVAQSLVESEEHPVAATCRIGHDRIGLAGEALGHDRIHFVPQRLQVFNQLDGKVLVELYPHGRPVALPPPLGRGVRHRRSRPGRAPASMRGMTVAVPVPRLPRPASPGLRRRARVSPSRTAGRCRHQRGR